MIKRDGKISKNPPIRKLEFSIEDQIFRIFRRVKLVSTTSATSCLFSIPARDGFVYVNNKGTPCKGTKMSKYKDELVDRLNRLYDTTLNRRNSETASGDDDALSDAEDSDGSMGGDMKCDGLTWGMPYSYQYLVSNEYGKNQHS